MRKFAVTLAVFVCTAVAQTLPSGVKKITSVEGITEYRLGQRPPPCCCSPIRRRRRDGEHHLPVGSRHEGYGETGMAHLLEHMLFSRVANHPKTVRGVSGSMARIGTEPRTGSIARTIRDVPGSDENLNGRWRWKPIAW